MLANEITKENIEAMVMSLYRLVLKDDIEDPFLLLNLVTI